VTDPREGCAGGGAPTLKVFFYIKKVPIFGVNDMVHYLLRTNPELKITASQRTMTGQNKHLTGQMSFEN